MINNKQSVNQPVNTDLKSSTARPNEQGSVSVTGFVRIFDPKTKETFVETRA